LINENPTYCHEACLQTIQVTSADLPGKSTSPTKNQGMPNVKLKPIFLDKYFKFARTVAKCAVPADCDPIHVAVFLTQWTSKRSYSIAGIKELVQWVSEVHSLVDNKPLYQHPRLEEFVTTMEQRLTIKQELGVDVKPHPLIDTKKENEYYGDIITNPFDIITATVCKMCNEKFQHTTKLLYHMLHLHKVNPVHFINKHIRAKPVRCNHCEKPCMSPITYAIHADQHLLKKPHQCSTCSQKYSSYLKFYTEDFCGDNAIPKNVKMFVNNTVAKLKYVEEDTEIIGENFSNHYTSYAKRHTINELPRDYKRFKKSKFVKSKSAYKQYTDVHDIYYEMYNYIPETIEEWIINIPTMLDARVSLSVVDKQRSDKQLEEEFEWVMMTEKLRRLNLNSRVRTKILHLRTFVQFVRSLLRQSPTWINTARFTKLKLKKSQLLKRKFCLRDTGSCHVT